MTIKDLTRDQLIQLKQRQLISRSEGMPEGPSWGELADADLLISDAELEDIFGGVDFCEDDFFHDSPGMTYTEWCPVCGCETDFTRGDVDAHGYIRGRCRTCGARLKPCSVCTHRHGDGCADDDTCFERDENAFPD